MATTDQKRTFPFPSRSRNACLVFSVCRPARNWTPRALSIAVPYLPFSQPQLARPPVGMSAKASAYCSSERTAPSVPHAPRPEDLATSAPGFPFAPTGKEICINE
jgi:hypothetical protein